MSDLHDASARIALEGSIGIRDIEAVHADILGTMAQHTSVVIDCSALTGADLSLLQLLLAARRSAQAAGTQLTLQPVPALEDALQRGGFLHDGADPFWSGE